MSALAQTLLLATLVQSGADPAAPAADRYLDAVRAGDVARVKAALDAGVPVDTKFRYDRTALSFACDRGQIEVVRLLLDRGADVKLRDTFYKSAALDWALNKGHVEIARLLIERGAEAGADMLGAGVDRGDAALVALALEKAKLSADDLASALVAANRKADTRSAELLQRAGAKLPPPANFAVDAATLASYAGRYRSETAGFELHLELRDGVLACANCAQEPTPLGAVDAVTFRPTDDVRPKFVFELRDGRVAGVEVDFGEGARKLTRLEDVR